jgi:hypothetical protein
VYSKRHSGAGLGFGQATAERSQELFGGGGFDMSRIDHLLGDDGYFVPFGASG